MQWPAPMGHEYAGIVEEVGSDVRTVRPGQFVVGSFFASDNTCEICLAGYQSSCVQRQAAAATGGQAEYLRVPLADGTLVATADVPSDDLVPSLLAASDVLGTGWFAAVAAEAAPGRTVAVVGGGAVGLLAVLAASQLGAERIIAMSRHAPRQQLAREYRSEERRVGKGGRRRGSMEVSSRRRHTRLQGDWSSDVCSSDLDVLGTGWFAAVAAEAAPGRTVAVVGGGAVGLLAVLAASQLGAERIIAMSRHAPRQQLAREY